jgi:ectoine utilization protein EutC
MTITILNEQEIRKCVSLDAGALKVIEQGFARLAAGEVTVPPILRIDIPENHGEVDVKTAYIHGLDSFAIKIAAGFSDNYLMGLPTGNGMMILISARSGRPEAVLLDNGYLTDVRTGAAGAVAAQQMARQQIETAGVIGAGMQARYQMRALKLVRDFQRILVYSIPEEQIFIYSEEMSADLGVEVVHADSAEQVVRESDLVVTTTPSHQPYLKAEWLHPGLHITCMGSDSEEKQEVYADVFRRVDRIACDRKLQCFRLGELHHALEEGVLSTEHEILELGELVSGQKPGRMRAEDITICDLTGVGVQDTQIALLAYQRAVEKGFGLRIG